MGTISEFAYTDIAVDGSMLYACHFGAVSRAKIHVFDENIPWAIIDKITLPSDGAYSIHVSSITNFI